MVKFNYARELERQLLRLRHAAEAERDINIYLVKLARYRGLLRFSKAKDVEGCEKVCADLQREADRPLVAPAHKGEPARNHLFDKQQQEMARAAAEIASIWLEKMKDPQKLRPVRPHDPEPPNARWRAFREAQLAKRNKPSPGT